MIENLGFTYFASRKVMINTKIKKSNHIPRQGCFFDVCHLSRRILYELVCPGVPV